MPKKDGELSDEELEKGRKCSHILSRNKNS